MSAPCFTEDEYWDHKSHAERVNRRLRVGLVIAAAAALALIAWRYV